MSNYLISNYNQLLGIQGQRIAFFPGTFDPIHDGHVAVIEYALRHYVDCILICVHSHNRKKHNLMNPIKLRVEMILRLLLSRAQNDVFVIDPDYIHGIENDRFIKIARELITTKRTRIFILRGQDSLLGRIHYPLHMFDHLIHNRGGKEIRLDINFNHSTKVIRFNHISNASSTEVKKQLSN
ncbi:cytidyltransferase-like domain-containing protein [Nitrosomonas aestuarii]|uniref:nicotinate-nucleotide adenylyltransferase n=1 Tax=Nitrosomonas aestuarii TaxID=52441 RepID=A0A1I4BMG5_9PROT|nr:adenylyltransferase/cytidyltransferase family protein [Nitrosomonas aestuarii]SFK69580.1 cytidyltransferase-like domain-containing protein [Nitrosomonas aestuarii]